LKSARFDFISTNNPPGSGGTLMFDLALIFQFFIYTPRLKLFTEEDFLAEEEAVAFLNAQERAQESGEAPVRKRERSMSAVGSVDGRRRRARGKRLSGSIVSVTEMNTGMNPKERVSKVLDVQDVEVKGNYGGVGVGTEEE
jgi:hypothetical protein